MKENDKIYVSEYLKHLNEEVNDAAKFHKLEKKYIRTLTCKDIAKSCEVTPATISNLTTSSKFYLLHKVSEEIYDAYYSYFCYIQDAERKEYPDEVIYPKDINYVLMCLTTYYAEEFIRY